MDVATLHPLAPSRDGVWRAPGVVVTRRPGPHRRHPGGGWLCAPRFCARRRDGLLNVHHNLRPGELCDELAVLLAEQLVDTGAVRGRAEFESVFIGVVRSTVSGGPAAWLHFYRNSLRALESGTTPFAAIHGEAAARVRGRRIVDLGSCFGFFPLRLAQQGFDVLATDVDDTAMLLLRMAGDAVGRPLSTMVCDAADVAMPDACADTVTALHLIEHLPTAAITAVLNEALRLARHRVVVAVPFEDEPRACYGHIQRFDLPRLQRIADAMTTRHHGVSAAVYEHHGGWLILDR